MKGQGQKAKGKNQKSKGKKGDTRSGAYGAENSPFAAIGRTGGERPPIAAAVIFLSPGIKKPGSAAWLFYWGTD